MRVLDYESFIELKSLVSLTVSARHGHFERAYNLLSKGNLRLDSLSE